MAVGLYNKIIVSGTMPGGEAFSTGCAFRDASGTNLVGFLDLDTWLNDDVTGGTWATALAALLAGANSLVTATRLSAQYVDASGRVHSASNRGVSTAGGLTPGSSALPNSCAVVASLRTTEPGARGRGRMYLPWNQPSRNSDGTLSLASSAATNTKTFLAKCVAAANAVSTGGNAFSPVVPSSAGTGNLYIVTRIQAGNVIDTQRRRRNRQVEVYSSVNFP